MGKWRQILGLYLQLVKREVVSRYRGTALGLGWSFLHPLLMLAVYAFVFGTIFPSRWPQAGGQMETGEFALILFSGLMLHGLMAETLIKAVTAVTSQVNYVKKIIFPLPLLPLVPLGAALVHLTASLLILLGAMCLVKGSVPLTLLWLPLVVLPFGIALAGAALLLASLGVYLRDIGQLIGLLMTVLLFLSPIFYPAEALPEAFQPLLMMNPLSLIITQMREVLIWGNAPQLLPLLLYGVLASLFTLVCAAFFQRVRKGFADVL